MSAPAFHPTGYSPVMIRRLNPLATIYAADFDGCFNLLVLYKSSKHRKTHIEIL